MTADRNAERTTAPITEDFYRDVILPYMEEHLFDELNAVMPKGVRLAFDAVLQDEEQDL